MNQVHDSPAITFRYPATANLMLDSADRNVGASANSFSITRPQALLNGFFTRVGTTELVLGWGQPNIDPAFKNNDYRIDVSGAGAATGSNFIAGDISGAFINVETWASLVGGLLGVAGAATTPATTWTTANPRPGYVSFTPNQPVWVQLSGGLFQFGRLYTPPATYVLIDPTGATGAAEELSIGNGTAAFTKNGYLNLQSPSMDLRAIRYLDFVSAQLTYNQDLKDSSSAPIVRDVLARWYMSFDNQTRVDAYGFPVLMGYESFDLRRLFNPPKQIRWDNIQPVGNLSFQVYTDAGVLAPMRFSNWLMTLQVSEN